MNQVSGPRGARGWMLVVYQSCKKKSGWREESRSPDLPGSRGRSNQPFAESVAELSGVISMTSLAAHDEQPPQESQTALGVRVRTASIFRISVRHFRLL